jgi:dTDP-4-amino-4,6-dideoxygalactose transaminase
VIPFNRPYMTGNELGYIAEAHANGHLAGNGAFSRRCCAWLEERIGSPKALLTHSCTAALEMAAILSGVGPGDEVIMPSFTFVSTANAFTLRGATPVFVDIRADTLNLDETRIEAAITPRTKAIVPVHYAGVGCDMDAIMDIAARHDLLVIEDAAQGLIAGIRGRPLGGIGHLAALSFHETKNIISGEGGALLVNDPRFADRAEIIWEKGTNRSQFFRGQVDKYTWVDLGSSYLPGEIVAAFLWAQMEEADAITRRRIAIWERYHAAFADLEAAGLVRRPIVPAEATHNGHMYYLLLPDLAARTAFIDRLRSDGIQAVFHYIPLHTSPFGRSAGRAGGELTITDDVSDRLVRLPFWIGIEDVQDEVIERVIAAVEAVSAAAGAGARAGAGTGAPGQPVGPG